MGDARFRAACVQLNSGADMAANLDAVTGLIRQAREAGADFIVTPETTNIMQPDTAALHAAIHGEAEDPVLRACRVLAAELSCWLLIGSLAIRHESDERVANRSFLIAPDGTIRARYDKIHMFDVDLPGGKRYRESAAYRPGSEAVIATLPWAKLGMSICYDIRFPYLYRALARGGATVLSTPAAFTRTTGQAHWHVLQRARAIENGCFVIAAAQCGDHPGARQTYGHSLIVDPWGRILAEADEAPGIVVADIDMGEVDRVRAMVPSLSAGRDFTLKAL